MIVKAEGSSLPRGASGSARWRVLGVAVACAALFVTTAGDAPAGDAKVGRTKATQCQACHGLDGISKLPEAPHIAGQPEPYIVKSLRAYRHGTRKDEMMSLVAKQLTNQDIEDIAAYYSSIEFSVRVPQ